MVMYRDQIRNSCPDVSECSVHKQTPMSAFKYSEIIFLNVLCSTVVTVLVITGLQCKHRSEPQTPYRK